MYCQNFMVGVIRKKKSQKTLSIGEGKAIMKKMFVKHYSNEFGEYTLKSKNKSRESKRELSENVNYGLLVKTQA